jgi:hypothetical protein
MALLRSIHILHLVLLHTNMVSFTAVLVCRLRGRAADNKRCSSLAFTLQKWGGWLTDYGFFLPSHSPASQSDTARHGERERERTSLEKTLSAKVQAYLADQGTSLCYKADVGTRIARRHGDKLAGQAGRRLKGERGRAVH